MVAGVATFCVVDGRTGRALYEADFGSTRRRVRYFSSSSLSSFRRSSLCIHFLPASETTGNNTDDVYDTALINTGRRETLATIRHRIIFRPTQRTEMGNARDVFKNHRHLRRRLLHPRVRNARQHPLRPVNDETRGTKRETVFRNSTRSDDESANESILLRRFRRPLG